MKSFGINKYDAIHEQIVKLAQVFDTDFPDAPRIPSLAHTKKLLQFLTTSEIQTITIYNSFRKHMSNKFDKYDDNAFRESLTQFSDFKNNSNNGGKMRKSEIMNVVNTLDRCKPFNAKNKVTFRHLMESLTGQNMRLYVDNDQKDTLMKFDKDPFAFMRNFGGTQNNF